MWYQKRTSAHFFLCGTRKYLATYSCAAPINHTAHVNRIRCSTRSSSKEAKMNMVAALIRVQLELVEDVRMD